MFIEHGDIDGLSAYCASLPIVMKKTVVDLIGDEEVLGKLTFKGDGLESIIGRDLTKWGYTDFKLNLMKARHIVNGEPMDDQMMIEIRHTARQDDYGDRSRKSFSAISDQIGYMCGKNKFHPVKDYLTDLEWDGRDWLGHFYSHFTDEHEPVVYADGRSQSVFAALHRRWMIGAIAKAMNANSIAVQNPMLVLSGGQGLGKSTLAQWMCPKSMTDYFVEQPIDPESKDDVILLTSKWIWEVAELDATTRKKDVSLVKGFLTKTSATFRAPYDKYDVKRPAVASFIGTINKGTGFLNDPTGDRRYNIVELESVNFDYTKIDVDQLWAQALHLWQTDPSSWRLSPEELDMRAVINEEHTVRPHCESEVEQLFEITGNAADYLPLADVAKLIETRYSIKAMSKPLSDTLKSLGCLAGKAKHPVTGKQVRVWRGIKKLDGKDGWDG